MPEMILENQAVQWTLRHSPRRRTIQIQVISAQSVRVTAPKGYSEAMAENLLLKKSKWVLRHLRRLETATHFSESLQFLHGTSLLYRGLPHELVLLADGGKKPHVTLHQQSIAVHLNELIGDNNHPLVVSSLQAWYWNQAKTLLEQRTAYWAGQIGVWPSRLCLRDQKSRWGSCSSSGSINYNWRLILAPPDVLDYLVIHELCHLQHPNHSKAFWQFVASWCPNYQLHRSWLKENGVLLGKLFGS